MEAIKEAVLSGHIIAWFILLLVFILFLKFLKSAGKGLVYLLLIILLLALLQYFFPDMLQPAIDYFAGGWMGD
jgi:hypothetical protein